MQLSTTLAPDRGGRYGPICSVINALPGCRVSCISNVDSDDVSIWFDSTSMRAISFLGRVMDPRYAWQHFKSWQLIVDNSDINHDCAVFRLTSLNITQDEAFDQLDDLIINMNEHINDPGYIKLFLGNLD